MKQKTSSKPLYSVLLAVTGQHPVNIVGSVVLIIIATFFYEGLASFSSISIPIPRYILFGGAGILFVSNSIGGFLWRDLHAIADWPRWMVCLVARARDDELGQDCRSYLEL